METNIQNLQSLFEKFKSESSGGDIFFVSVKWRYQIVTIIIWITIAVYGVSHSNSESKYIVCPACEDGILDIVAEVGIESEGDREKFQSISSAHDKIYKLL